MNNRPKETYNFQQYKADLDALIKDMAEQEKLAQSENNEDNVTFLQDLKCIKALAKAWIGMVNADGAMALNTASSALEKAFSENKFTSGDYYPSVQGLRSLQLAQAYLSLLQKAMFIATPQIGNFITQPLINKSMSDEKQDTARCVGCLNKLIESYQLKSAPPRP